jgi:cation:H+ antiporter
MSSGLAILLFLASFALAVVSSFVLANSINRIGVRLGFSGALLGLITALGADSPEISSTATALMSGRHELALGVILGSNIFNIAAMLGVGAVVAGYVRISFRGLIFNGSVAFAITLVAAALVVGWVPPWLGFLLIVVIIGPYIVVCATGTRHLPRFMRRFLAKALSEVQHDVRKEEAHRRASWSSNLSIVPAVASVIWASIGMVHAAVALAEGWKIPHVVVGVLILATLTGVPNMLTALQLARRGHGSAVVSEALNSNNINVIFGLCLPAILVGISHPSKLAVISLLWLLGVTFLALVLAITRKGVRRWEGALLVVIYLCFAIFVVSWKG